MGVGTVRVADRDVAERTNLHRQVLFDEDDVLEGSPKAHIAGRKLRRANPAVTVETHAVEVGPDNIEALIEGADVVLDGTDNFETRYVINDACVKRSIPWIYGGVLELGGMTLVVIPGQTPCLRCLFPDPPAPGTVPTTSEVGILPTLPALIAARQVTEAVKILVEPAAVQRDLIQLDLWENTFRALSVRPEPACPACVQRRFHFLDA
jgi:adenylyltransferase/sulfurtransferase